VEYNTAPNFVAAFLSFTAHREIDDGRFTCVTQFDAPLTSPPDYATNDPDYTHVHNSNELNVQWGPTSMTVTPIKPYYVEGDNLTCFADSDPVPRYVWANMRTFEIEPAGDTFTIGPDLVGFDQVMRCYAEVQIEGSLFTNNIFVNVSVPLVTTPTLPTTTPTTTPPPPDSPCVNPTGTWSATNPTARMCVEVDEKGNLYVLIRNGTDLFFVPGNGKTVINDYKHIGFGGIWPSPVRGVGGFAGECHRCNGNEVMLISGTARHKSRSPACGTGSEPQQTNQYVFTRFGPPCTELKVYRPSKEHIKIFGITPDRIME